MTATVSFAPGLYRVTGAAGLVVVLAGCTTGTDATTGSTPSRSAPATSSASPPATSSATTASTSVAAEPVDTVFRKKVEAMCGEWLQYATNHQYPFENANPEIATATQLPQIAAYLDAVPMNHEAVVKATAVGTPSQGGAAWAAVVKDLDRYQTTITAAIASAKSGDLSSWKQAANQWEAAKDAVRADLTTAGIGGSQNSCQFLFSRSSSQG